MPDVKPDHSAVYERGVANRKNSSKKQGQDVGNTNEGVLQGVDNQPELLELGAKRGLPRFLLSRKIVAFSICMFVFHLYPGTISPR